MAARYWIQWRHHRGTLFRVVPGLYSDAPKRNLIVLLLYLWLVVALLPFVL